MKGQRCRATPKPPQPPPGKTAPNRSTRSAKPGQDGASNGGSRPAVGANPTPADWPARWRAHGVTAGRENRSLSSRLTPRSDRDRRRTIRVLHAHETSSRISGHREQPGRPGIGGMGRTAPSWPDLLMGFKRADPFVRTAWQVLGPFHPLERGVAAFPEALHAGCKHAGGTAVSSRPCPGPMPPRGQLTHRSDPWDSDVTGWP